MPGITDPQWQAIRRTAGQTARAEVQTQLSLLRSDILATAAADAAEITRAAVGEIVADNRARVRWLNGAWELHVNSENTYRPNLDPRTAGVAKVVSDHGFPLSGRTHDHNKKAIQFLKDNESQCMFAVDGVLYVGPKDRRNPVWDAPPPSLKSVSMFQDHYTGPVQVTVHGQRQTIAYNDLRRLLHKNPRNMAVSIDGVMHIMPQPKPQPMNIVNEYFKAFGEISPALSEAIDKEVDRRVAEKMERVYNGLFNK
jgi:hypothetical protein